MPISPKDSAFDKALIEHDKKIVRYCEAIDEALKLRALDIAMGKSVSIICPTSNATERDLLVQIYAKAGWTVYPWLGSQRDPANTLVFKKEK